MYLPAKTLESVFNIDSLAMPFVNVTIHWLPFMVHFTALAIAYLSDRIKRVNQSFCQAPAGLFDLFENPRVANRAGRGNLPAPA